MSNIAIQVENLSKSYTLRHESAERYVALRDVLTRKFSSFQNIFKASTPAATTEIFHALRDVSFTIQQGEAVGIIGRNGAGKSTLLKLLSRIIEPSGGRIRLRGRVASLLEVGTGFHPELTGRENIFLNGAILGMTRHEIRQKFDAIVEFADIEQFLDTPVKRYSSGMYMRLAFSIAAHLEPEILLVDEVLAVGDASFQKKCLGKMDEVSRQQGRTVLFVSHNMGAIQQLCERGILLEGGKIKKLGRIEEVLANNSIITICDYVINFTNNIFTLHRIGVINNEGVSHQVFNINERVGLRLNYTVHQPDKILWIGYNLYDNAGNNIFDTHSITSPYYTTPHPLGAHQADVWIPANLLAEGIYSIGLGIFNHLEHRVYFHQHNIISFQIQDTFDGTTARGFSKGHFAGLVRPLLEWQIYRIA